MYEKWAQDMYNIQCYKTRSVYQQEQNAIGTMAIIPSMKIFVPIGDPADIAIVCKERGTSASRKLKGTCQESLPILINASPNDKGAVRLADTLSILPVSMYRRMEMMS